jgi:hypothetical protein
MIRNVSNSRTPEPVPSRLSIAVTSLAVAPDEFRESTSEKPALEADALRTYRLRCFLHAGAARLRRILLRVPPDAVGEVVDRQAGHDLDLPRRKFASATRGYIQSTHLD